MKEVDEHDGVLQGEVDVDLTRDDSVGRKETTGLGVCNQAAWETVWRGKNFTKGLL